MVSCGEASGDLYAAALVADLKRIAPTVDVFGFGGPRLAAAGVTLLDDYRQYSVTGLSEALRVMPPGADVPWLRRARARLKARAKPSRDKRRQIVPVRERSRGRAAISNRGSRCRYRPTPAFVISGTTTSCSMVTA